MATTFKTIDTDLVGALVEKKDGLVTRVAWPVDEPNASGEHIATVRAVWLDESNAPKVLLSTPRGNFFETYPHAFRLLRIATR